MENGTDLLQRLSQLGRIEEEREIIKGLKVKLHTLSDEEQSVLAKVASSAEEIIQNYPIIQRITLVSATSSITIDGIAIDKSKLEDAYKSMQYGVLNSIYEFYIELTRNQLKIIDELKKN